MSHLWSREEAGFTPRLVVVEYGENLPFMEDVLVRYTSLPILAASIASVCLECGTNQCNSAHAFA